MYKQLSLYNHKSFYYYYTPKLKKINTPITKFKKEKFMKTIRIEKRIPFGFMGDWGQVYKLYTYEEKNAQAVVKWQDKAYVDLGQDVQFKYLEDGIDKQTKPSQPLENRVTKGEYRIAETTDAYFDADSGGFECVVEISDIVNVFGRWWVVDSIDEKSIFTPNKQTFYYIGLKRIKEEVVRA